MTGKRFYPCPLVVPVNRPCKKILKKFSKGQIDLWVTHLFDYVFFFFKFLFFWVLFRSIPSLLIFWKSKDVNMKIVILNVSFCILLRTILLKSFNWNFSSLFHSFTYSSLLALLNFFVMHTLNDILIEMTFLVTVGLFALMQWQEEWTLKMWSLSYRMTTHHTSPPTYTVWGEQPEQAKLGHLFLFLRRARCVSMF